MVIILLTDLVILGPMVACHSLGGWLRTTHSQRRCAIMASHARACLSLRHHHLPNDRFDMVQTGPTAGFATKVGSRPRPPWRHGRMRRWPPCRPARRRGRRRCRGRWRGCTATWPRCGSRSGQGRPGNPARNVMWWLRTCRLGNCRSGCAQPSTAGVAGTQ